MKLLIDRGAWKMIFLFLSLSFGSLKAQNIQLILDPLSPYSSSSLFNLTLINLSSNSGNVELKAELKTRQGKLLLQQTTNTRLNGNESLSLRGTSVTASTIYLDSDFSTLYSEGEMLPPLDYVLCVSANFGGDLNSMVNECEISNVADFINLIAIYPSDGSIVYEKQPVFSWVDLSPSINHSIGFRLVQIHSGQNPNEALRRNSPIIVNDQSVGNSLAFPPDAMPLENNKQYAWQTSLNLNGETIATSKPWQFTYKELDTLVDVPRNPSYVDITQVEQGANLFAVGKFKFKFTSQTTNSLKARLFQIKKDKKKELDLEDATFNVKTGTNKFEVDLQKQVYLKHKQDYQIQITEENSGQVYWITINYLNPDYLR